MTKIIYFNIPSIGHVNPTLPIINALVQAGQQIICVNTETHRKKIEETGALFIAYPDSQGMEKYMDDSIATGNIIANMYDLIKLSYRLYDFSVSIIQQENPDMVINDSLASWAKIAAQAQNIPRLCFITTFVLNAKTIQLSTSALFDLAGKLLYYFPQYCLFALFMKLKTKQFPVPLTHAGMAIGMKNIVFTSKDFQPNSIKLGKHFHFVGSTFLNRKESHSFDFNLINTKPLIYISLGTLIRNPAFFELCFQAFSQYQGTFILSIGKHFDTSSLTPIPENFIVGNTFPQIEILKHADVFISHAGLNSTHESLVLGVPMLLIPQQLEQSIVAKQVEKNGAGIALQTSPPYGKVSASQLFDALNTILNTSSYRTNAKKLGETLLPTSGITETARLIIDFAKCK